MILVCFAVQQEAAPFSRRASGLPGVQTAVLGMGREASEEGIASRLQEQRFEAVLTCGFAGGLNPALRQGQVLYSADPGFALEPALREAGALPGRFLCSPSVLATTRAKLEAYHRTTADAVEMESEWIRTCCRKSGVPSATLRVILDEAEADLPLDFNTIMSPGQKISPTKLARALLRDPGLAGALWRFGKESRRAAESLAEVLVKALRR